MLRGQAGAMLRLLTTEMGDPIMFTLTVRRSRQLLAVLIGVLAPFVANAAYVLSEFTRPAAAYTQLFDVNNSGQMVGYSFTGAGPTQGFLYNGGTFTSIAGPAGAFSSAATGISDGGVIVGSFATSDADPQQGFIYSGGSYTAFIVAGAINTFLRGISPDGRYISGYYSTTSVLGIGFLYDMVSGTLYTNISQPNSLLTIAQGVTDAGVLVGSDSISGPPTTRPGFVYDLATGTRTDVAIAGADRTALRAIDDAGIIAGWFIDGVVTHGFVGSIASFEQIDFLGATATYVEGSNNARLLVGNYIDDEGNVHAFIAAPVHEPATLALLSLGLAGLATTRRRRH